MGTAWRLFTASPACFPAPPASIFSWQFCCGQSSIVEFISPKTFCRNALIGCRFAKKLKQHHFYFSWRSCGGVPSRRLVISAFLASYLEPSDHEKCPLPLFLPACCFPRSAGFSRQNTTVNASLILTHILGTCSKKGMSFQLFAGLDRESDRLARFPGRSCEETRTQRLGKGEGGPVAI